MTKISKIIKKYSINPTLVYNVIYSTKYYHSMMPYINNNQFSFTSNTNLDLFKTYDICIIDIENIDLIHKIYTHYLPQILVIDDELLFDKTKEYCDNKLSIYDKYRRMYPLNIIAIDLEQYLYNKSIYDDYMEIKNINSLLLKYII